MRAAGQRFKSSNPGFTLVELLTAVLLSALVIESLAQLAVQQINLANRVYGFSSTNRNFRRLSDLLKIEVGEACLLRKGLALPTTYTWPNNPCKPLSTSACSTSSSNNKLYLLIPIQGSDNSIVYSNTAFYYLSGTDLLREGPQVGTDGLLSSTANVTGRRVLTNVTTFIPSVSADCTSVDLEVGVTYPGKAEVRRTLSFYSGATEMIN